MRSFFRIYHKTHGLALMQSALNILNISLIAVLLVAAVAVSADGDMALQTGSALKLVP